MGDLSHARRSTDDSLTSGDRKRLGGKASSLFARARNSLHLPRSSAVFSSSPTNSSTTMDGNRSDAERDLGKEDPAVVAPQDSHDNSAAESRPGPWSTFTVGVSEDCNSRSRRSMEDSHSVIYNFMATDRQAARDGEATTNAAEQQSDDAYLGLYDGHNGKFASDWCHRQLHVILADAIREKPNSPIPELLDQAFTTADQELEKQPLKTTGTTAIVALLRWEERIPNSNSATGSAPLATAAASRTSIPHSQLQRVTKRQRVLYTANVGDSRAVLCRNGKALRLSYDHKGSDELEGKRVANSGGLILNGRVNGVLAVTRALGDTYMKDVVTSHPYTTETVIQPDSDEFIILACDGLWDVCSDQTAVDLIRQVEDPQVASKMLVDHALKHFSTDNLSVMVIRLHGAAMRKTIEHGSQTVAVENDSGPTKPDESSTAEHKT